MQETENIKVSFRFRPPTGTLNKETLVIDTKNNCITDKESRKFIFDHVFDYKTSQEEIFNTVANSTIDWVCKGYNATIFAYGPTGCLDPDTKVLMYNGSHKRARNIKIGDLLMGDDSTPRKVLKLFTGYDDMYDIIPESGDIYRVNKEHILTLKSVVCPRDVIDISVKDYLEKDESWRQKYKGLIASVEYNEIKVDIDPYILGIILNDEYIYNYTYSNDVEIKFFINKYYSDYKNIFIPKQYMNNSRKNRLKLLSAFLDNNKNNTIVSNPVLVNDLYILSRSLGFTTKRIDKNTIKILMNGLYISTTDITVKYANYGKYNGFMLDGNHRFLLHDFTVTHNSGKTFTMFGTPNTDNEGIVPRSCKALFQNINNNQEVVTAELRCSFLEIYREHIRDLINTEKDISEPLKIRKDDFGNVHVPNIIQKHIYTPEDLLDVLKLGLSNRSTSSTSLNDVSSRSHAIITLYLSQSMSDGTDIVSKLNLVDLAGSENVGRSEVKGVQLLEAQNINKSLSCLGNVIYALTEKGREHIPYRDSRLTFLLQDSLGGNSKTTLIATASPNLINYSETYNTLKFAQRVKEIKNIPKINKNESIPSLLKTIEELKTRIAELEENNNSYGAMMKEIEEKTESKGDVDLFYKLRCKRLEKQLSDIEESKIIEKERRKQYKELETKQRNMTHNLAKDLYKERLKSFSLQHELEQYKIVMETIKGAIQTPHILPRIIEKINIKNININPDIYDIDLPDIDSP